ncbi:MAG: MOSC domain-containing protein [Firmicutes bacterium]|nr:MOSC domain-containing protein [Bacillota bacterium]
MTGRVVAVSISDKQGVKKNPIDQGQLLDNYGLQGDVHAGPWHRQVSLLAQESIDKMRSKGLELSPGDFAENITTSGIDLLALPIGSRLRIGSTAILEVTQHGKECHHHCAIYRQVGDCVMPREGIFVRVLKGGPVKAGDEIEPVKLITVGVLIASDKGARGEREDKCSDLIEKMVEQIAGEVIQQAILPDEEVILKEKLLEWADEWKLDLILTSGGTGLGPRDVTPEATRAVIEREAPGIGEAMRLAGLKNTPRAMLSRAVAGTRGGTLIINLPGSPRGVEESLGAILEALPHAVETVKGEGGDCASQR